MTDNNAPPCSWKLHAFKCGCEYITPCKCHATPENHFAAFYAADRAAVKREKFSHSCRDCQLQALDDHVEKAKEWRDMMNQEYCRHDHPHPDMRNAMRDLQKAEQKRDRVSSSIEATMFDYAKRWTKLSGAPPWKPWGAPIVDDEGVRP